MTNEKSQNRWLWYPGDSSVLLPRETKERKSKPYGAMKVPKLAPTSKIEVLKLSACLGAWILTWLNKYWLCIDCQCHESVCDWIWRDFNWDFFFVIHSLFIQPSEYPSA